MKKSTDLRHGRTCVFGLHVHLVFVTKYRHSVFTKQVLKDLTDIFSSVCRDFGATLEEMEGERDHVHLLINYPPKFSVSKLVNSLKGGVVSVDSEKETSHNRKSLMGWQFVVTELLCQFMRRGSQ